MAISPEIHLQPGSHINLPASLINTGTWDIVFGNSNGAFESQFNGLTLRPGESYDFAYLNINVHADAPLGAIAYQNPILGIAFPDGANLLAAGFTAPAQPGFRTRIIIDTDTYALPLSLHREAQSGYFRSSNIPTQARIALTSFTELAYADVTMGYQPQAANLAVLAIPEPQTWLMLSIGLILLAAKTNRKTAQTTPVHADIPA